MQQNWKSEKEKLGCMTCNTVLEILEESVLAYQRLADSKEMNVKFEVIVHKLPVIKK
jgi:hypothetical protein